MWGGGGVGANFFFEGSRLFIENPKFSEGYCDIFHWRIEGGGKGAFPPPPKMVKVW